MGLAVGAVAIFPCAAGLCSFGDSERSGFGLHDDGRRRRRRRNRAPPLKPPGSSNRKSPNFYRQFFLAILNEHNPRRRGKSPRPHSQPHSPVPSLKLEPASSPTSSGGVPWSRALRPSSSRACVARGVGMRETLPVPGRMAAA